jgi:hypothetical protein
MEKCEGEQNMFGLDQLVWRFAIYAPLLLVWLIGLIISLVTWRKHPQVSLLAAVGFGIQLLQSTAWMLFFYWITSQRGAFGWSAENMSLILGIANLIQTSLSAIAWVLIILAIFRWRYQPNRILGHDGQYLPEAFDADATQIK